MTMIDVREIMKILPHRYPFLLIDRILEIKETSILAIKNVTYNEPFFQGHFPGHPVMPGVLIVEAMAQAGGALLLGKVEDREDKLIFFTGIDNCRFRQPVVPGDQVVFEVEIAKARKTFAKMRGRALVDGQVVCEADLMSAMADRP
ncbi:MAG: 3-hydroxyacyl-[acyl-carrier-protein] dehydratase FabZ [Acidobacteria bacterium]|nr:MAG: 3-hydroxyacyl-[acyl-carrier-protein] dehydratase FabZ [Acidobacteriota bacterium]RLE36344.1 MAG: 3-hydroxyacyl-[acyl-carrier-protein] dehydratase FabZ [Acidobacteriota bacterium]